MMLALALASVVDPSASAEDITVTARLERVRLALGHDAQGKITCQLSRSSGDARIDGAVCREAGKCAGRMPAAANACIDARKKELARKWRKGMRS